MEERLIAWARQRGYRVAWGASGKVADARGDIERHHAAGELDEAFYRDELAPVLADARLPDGAAVVAVAKPVPAHRVRFDLDGEALDAVLPPTYVRYRATFEEVRQDLAAHGLAGFRVEHLAAPVKAVAARLGLVRYGRNNVTYADGPGSYVQLCAFVTDAPLPVNGGGPAGGPELLDECASCGACASACPTGAIDDERVLLHAERCLTFFNERPGDWPGWLSPRGHHCLLGCLACQQACPANPPLEVAETGVVFSASETRALLDGKSAGRSNAETGVRAKLAWLGQPYAEPVLGRNLRALVAASARTAR